ncbi:MAG: sugar ABC transporter permease, partial [Burkholderiales bacterium]|nr:sugar ABC transporter permease [Anaerolineae bacterium]
VEGPTTSGETAQGWVSQSNLFIESRNDSTTARITSGEPTQEWTLDFVKRMLSDFRFGTALGTTLLLIVLIVPLQFVLAIIMALVLQSQIRGNSLFLYIFAIPLGISDLASGILWYAIFTQRGFLNSALVSLGILDSPYVFIQANNQGWMIAAIVLAEIWRATSIVMVIVVSGLQAIPRDYMEAGEVFGANLWQRLRYIILPLLKPSLQVALILRTILAFQVFSVVVAITGGNVVTVLANETYRWYDPARFNNPNMAAVYAGFIMLLSLGFSMFYLRAVRSQEEASKTI